MGLQTFEDAEKVCSPHENSSTLVIIRSKDEQDFLSNLLFKTHKILDNVWIGAKYTSNKFKWTDDSDLSFTNWGQGSPRNKTDYCVQMQSDEASVGKWIDEPCGKKNLVVCQKMQTWSISHLQKTLLDARKKLEDSLENVNKQLKESQEDRKLLNNSLTDIRKNPVPIGFIYVQLPNQPDPKSLWPTVEWTDVTSNYAGLFFRAEGGGAASFGQIQEENSPRLINARYKLSEEGCNEGCGLKSIEVNKNEWSKGVFTGCESEGNYVSLQFLTSNGEVRPRNNAVRIWRRTN